MCHRGGRRHANHSNITVSVANLAGPHWVLSTLLIAGAGLFAVGVAAERHNNGHHQETTATHVEGAEANPQTSAANPETPPATEAIGAESAATGEANPETPPATEATGSGSEGTAEPALGTEATSTVSAESGEGTVLGINLESNLFLGFAVAASVVVALLTWFIQQRLLLLAIAVFAGIFTVFDIAEVVHHINASKAGVAAIAVGVAVVHTASAIVAEQRATATTP